MTETDPIEDERPWYADDDFDDDGGYEDNTCPFCYGTGQDWDLTPCDYCDGEGYLWLR